MKANKKQDISPLTLFYSCADEDEELREKLEKHLSLLQREGMIAGWHHHRIAPGANTNQVRDTQLALAQMILLLVSPDFLASDVAHAEMQRALQRHKAGQAHVIPLLLRPVDWKLTPFADLQPLPRNGKPVTLWKNRDLAFFTIAKEIRAVLEQRNGPHDHSAQQSASPPFMVPPFPFVFLSYARKDLPLVERLKDDLQTHDILGWVDHQAFQPGNSDAGEKLREAIRNASAVILVASPHIRRSLSIKEELHIANMYQRPIYLFWMQGDQLIEVIPSGWNGLPSFDARGESYPQALQNLFHTLNQQAALFSEQDHITRESLSLLETPRNPYKGLQAFRAEDAQDFFGRDRLIEELLKNVQRLLVVNQQGEVTPRLLTVLGPSGSGKSSVVMAGLLPKLKQGALPDSQHWIYLDPITPGQHPIETLILTLAPLFPACSLKSIREDLEDDSARGLHLLLIRCLKQKDARVVLLIDQFEELFTQTSAGDERYRFLSLLLAATTEPSAPLLAVLTLRADFYHHTLQYPELGRLIEAHHVTVYPLETRDLRTVIEQPARLPDVQLTFEDDLVGDLLFEMQGQMGALPLLQFTLDQLFQHREGQMLMACAYQQIGGVKGALVQHAEQIYQSLPTPAHQRLAHALFLRLISPGTVEQDTTRRRVPLAELIVCQAEETTWLTEVRTAFTNARLLTTNVVGGIPIIEVSHEALIKVWPRLLAWVNEEGERDAIHVQQAISQHAAEWQQHYQAADRLYRGSQLAEALAWREAHLPSLDEDTFLQASIKESRREQRRSTRRRMLMGLVSAVGVVGTGLGVRAFLRTPTSFQIGLPYTGHTDAVNAVDWSPDGKRLASASNDHTVQVWESNNGTHLLTYTGHNTGVHAAVHTLGWSPDGKRIASGGDDKTVQVWDANSSNRLLTYTGHTAPVRTLGWSPDGKRIASGGDDKTVQVWDASTGKRLLTYTEHTSAVRTLGWSPDGKRIASGGDDKTVQVWDASSGNHLLTYTGHVARVHLYDNVGQEFGVWGVGWSPDGKHLASAGEDRTVQVWDASSGKLLLTYTGHVAAVYTVGWSLDGKRLASAGNDGTVQIWDASNGTRLLTYTGHVAAVYTVGWSPDGKRLASGSDDRTVQVWNSLALVVYRGHNGGVVGVGWSPDGKRLASGSDDRTVQMWEASSGNRLLTYTGHTSAVRTLGWSPDGKRIASGSDDKTVQVWEASSGKFLLTYTGHADTVWSLSWSLDGKRLASASNDKTVQVWDASSGKRLLTYTGHVARVHLYDNVGQEFGVWSVGWSPDGKHLASAGEDRTVQVWDASNGKRLLTYTGHVAAVYTVGWSLDGKRLASAGNDGTVQVWDASNGTRLLTYTGHTAAVHTVSWSPDGKRLASGSDDRTLQIWDASSGKLLLTYTGHAAAVHTVGWSPDGKRLASGGNDGTARVWWVL